MAEHEPDVRPPVIRSEYKGQLLRYRDPAQRVAKSSERRRERVASDPLYRESLRRQAAASRDPVAQQARRFVRTALRQGRLVRPSRCENCQSEGFIEAAHRDYAKPLDVLWLCQSCHRRWDRDEPKGNHGLVFVDLRRRGGESVASAKLTREQVAEIRALIGTVSLRELGRRFGVSHHAIRAIRDGRTWAA